MNMAEQRITEALKTYWQGLQKDGKLPSEQDINSEDIPQIWENCFLVRVDGKNNFQLV